MQGLRLCRILQLATPRLTQDGQMTREKVTHRVAAGHANSLAGEILTGAYEAAA